jgi:uncharacterized protein with HEPN domain
MSRDFRPFLDDIRRACEKVIRYTAGMDQVQFVTGEKTFDAVLRNLAIIGEAVKQIPQDFRDDHPHVEWQKIARFRDFVIHHYFAIDEQIIWDIVRNKVPQLLLALQPLPSRHTGGSLMRRLSPEVIQQVRAALQEYEREVEAANLARTTKDTYLLHASNFVRWLAGEFTPGSRNS